MSDLSQELLVMSARGINLALYVLCFQQNWAIRSGVTHVFLSPELSGAWLIPKSSAPKPRNAVQSAESENPQILRNRITVQSAKSEKCCSVSVPHVTAPALQGVLLGDIHVAAERVHCLHGSFCHLWLRHRPQDVH